MPAFGREHEIAPSVALECLTRGMELEAVALDHEPAPTVGEVDLEPGKDRVELES